jgi:hypothetical protein
VVDKLDKLDIFSNDPALLKGFPAYPKQAIDFTIDRKTTTMTTMVPRR